MIFFEIEDWPNYYINHEGEIFDSNKNPIKLNNRGRTKVELSRKVVDGVVKKEILFVDLLVANAFIPNVDKFKFVKHTNGILRDNNKSNLEWIRSDKNVCVFQNCYKQPIFNLPTEIHGKFCFEHKMEIMTDVVNKKCYHADCIKRPIFNLQGESKGKFCIDHKSEVMVNVLNKKCQYQECIKRPNFNFQGESKGRFCFEHKLGMMIDVAGKKCQYEGCLVQPSFNLPSETQGKYCSSHKLKDMVNVKSKKCVSIGCAKVPVFNFHPETEGKYCNYHKLDGMINIRDKKCQYIGCTRRPNFNAPTQSRAMYCYEHKSSGMVNINSKKCNYTGCDKQPTFNLPTESQAKYCFEHKTETMVNVNRKRCQQPGCMKVPTFNLPNETRGIYCMEHKMKIMVDVNHKKCSYKGCTKRPNFNFASETNAMYCYEHKQAGMVDKYTKKCLHDGCTKRSKFNMPGEHHRIYCSEHKKFGMVDICNKKCNKCKGLSVFGFPGKKAEFCFDHKLSGMINIQLESKCIISDCQKEYDVLVDDEKFCLNHCPRKDYEIALKRKCKYCDIEETSKFVCKDCLTVQNKKEWMIVRHLRKHIDTKFEYNSSKMLNSECSKKRPDVYFELLTHSLIVEIDENQHRSYEDSCECSRMNEIVNAIGGKPVIFIRFNPDTIRNKGKIFKVSLQDRLDLLVETIKLELIKEYESFQVLLIQLYYSDDLDTYEPVKTEDITYRVSI